MRRNFPAAFLLTAFLIPACTVLWAQEEPPYSVSWEAVPGAGGYRIEMRNERNEAVLTRVLREDALSYDFRLAPGKYLFRLTTLNRFMRDEASTSWLPIVIAAAKAPEIEDIRPRSFAAGKSQIIAISGKHFSKRISALLVDPEGRRIGLEALGVASDALRLSVPALEKPGDYGIILSNGGGLRAEALSALRVEGPEALASAASGARPAATGPVAAAPAETAPAGPAAAAPVTPQPGPETGPRAASPEIEPPPAAEVAAAPAAPFPRGSREGYRPFALSAAWEYEVPIGQWASVFSGTPMAFDLSADCFLSPHRRPKSGSSIDYALGLGFNAIDFGRARADLAAKSLAAYSATIHPLVSYSLPFMEASFLPGFGLSYASLSADGDGGSDRKATVDCLLDGRLRIQLTLSDLVGLGTGLGYRHYFFTRSMDGFDAAICLVLNLPARSGPR